MLARLPCTCSNFGITPLFLTIQKWVARTHASAAHAVQVCMRCWSLLLCPCHHACCKPHAYPLMHHCSTQVTVVRACVCVCWRCNGCTQGRGGAPGVRGAHGVWRPLQRAISAQDSNARTRHSVSEGPMAADLSSPAGQQQQQAQAGRWDTKTRGLCLAGVRWYRGLGQNGRGGLVGGCWCGPKQRCQQARRSVGGGW